MPILALEGAILQIPRSSPDRQPLEKPAPPFAVRYVHSFAARPLLAHPSSILGVVGYGAERPDFLPPAYPFVTAPLLPAAGSAMFEIWTTTSSSRPCQVGPVIGACSDELAFGAVKLEEAGNASLEATVEEAYLNIFNFMDRTGFCAPIRVWNYLTSITDDDCGLERYRRFNIGRHRAFSARLRQKLPPAASGVGGHQGASVIYFLAARTPASPIENPRQVSAYKYPPIYGPSSPSFSRASIYAQGSMEALFISGTASIVGHETRHRDDLPSQIAETIENLRALIGVAAQTASAPLSDHWALKIYLQNPAYREAVNPAIDAMFGGDSQRLYLHGDICRPGLLLEIEAFCHLGQGCRSSACA
jgi:chorismate lyase/3-hydroxybenzoate synthase